MIVLSLIRESLAALWMNRLRSGLTVLGMTLGVTSVIAVVSTVEGMQNSIEEAFASMGSNTFIVTRFGFGLSAQEYLERMHRRKLTRGLIEPIKQGCPDCAEVGAESYWSDQLKYGNRRMSYVEIQGNTPNILEMRDLDVATGRFISWEDDSRRKQVAFLGYQVYERLFDGMNAIGETIRIGKNEFVVIGVAEKLGGMLGEEMDEFVAIPLSTHQKLYHKPGNPVNLLISAVSLERRESAMDQARVVLRSARHVSYDDNDDFTIMTPDAILSFINDFTRGFRIVLISLPLLSIIIGGIVIMNIMMISVTERTREIGIRKSIGARRRHILVQFLYESTFMSLLGGSAGVFFGVLIGREVLTSLLDIYVTPTTLAIILGFGISTAVGLFFGIYPAVRASRFDPIKALSYE
jgi:putative ABC transport system permease protein